MIYYMNGEWVESSQAVLPVSDLSISRGMALFESVRTYNKTPFRLSDHIDRIIRSATEAKFNNVPIHDEVEQTVRTGIEKNHGALGEFTIKIMITAGSGTLFQHGNCRLIVMFDTANPPGQEKYNIGLALMSYRGPRFLANQKNTDYFSAGLGISESVSKGMDDILYRDEADTIYESATGNIFVVSYGKLLTPNEGILPGITRKIIIDEVAPQLGLAVEQKKLSFQDVAGADEVFLTGSIKEVIGVRSIDGKPVATDIGETTKKIHEKYLEIVKSETNPA